MQDAAAEPALPILGALDAGRAQSVAVHFSAGRAALSQVYAEIARRAGGRVRDFKIVALGRNDTADAFAAALVEMASAGIHRTFLTELATLGFLDLDAALNVLRAAQPGAGDLDTLLWPQDASGSRMVPQGWNALTAATLDMAQLLSAVNLAARRVCLVKAGVSQGTGFLIGSQTVLTNWHVMASMIDPATGKMKPDSARNIVCNFESLSVGQGRPYPAVNDWLVDFSPLARGPVAPAKAGADMTHLRPHALDFCALRLSGVPGRERGWYDLSQTGTLDSTTDNFFVFQHPFANPQRLAITSGVVADPTDPNFLRHMAWTDEGSSGGLCLDQQFRPVALHHAAVKNPAGEVVFNRAVFLSAINTLAPELGAPDPQYDRINQLADGSSVVLGRGETQALAQEMMRNPSRPILYVRGEPRSGRRFTALLIRDCTQHDLRRIVEISASELPVEACELAAMILTRAGAPAGAVAGLPGGNMPNGTDNAWIKSALLPALRQELTTLLRTDPAKPMVLWLMLHKLDIVPIPQTSARELLDALYAETETMPSLRIVLIGLNTALPGVDQALTRVEMTDHPDQVTTEALETCLGAMMADRMLAPAPVELKRQADLVNGVANMLQTLGDTKNRLERISDVLAKVWLPAAKKWR